MTDFPPPPGMEGPEFHGQGAGQNFPEDEGDSRIFDTPLDDDDPNEELFDTDSDYETSSLSSPHSQGPENLDNRHIIEGDIVTEDDVLMGLTRASVDRDFHSEPFDPIDRQAWHDALDAEMDMIERGEPSAARFSAWDAQRAGGEIVRMNAVKIVVQGNEKMRRDPEWPVVQRAVPSFKPIPPKTGKPVSKLRKLKQAYILPDTQIPYHDPEAMAVALQAVFDAQPEQIVLLGDYCDFPEQGRWGQEPEYSRTTQLAIDIGHRVLELLRDGVPDAKIVLLEGNHDKRLNDHIIKNAMGSFGLRQANAPPESWPVQSVPHLLRLDDLNVEYISGYPANKHWINERLKIIHGVKVNSNGSTAQRMDNSEYVSVIFGHIHKIETHRKTVENYHGPVERFAHTPGCLCLTDGSVPSQKSGRDGRTRDTVKEAMNWQQGFSSVLYDDRGEFTPILQSYTIGTHGDKYLTVVGNDVYMPDKKLVKEISPINFDSAYAGSFAEPPRRRRR